MLYTEYPAFLCFSIVLYLQIEELDYDARLGAYRRLDPSYWDSLVASGASAIVLQRCFLDLRNADDLALRHAAAQAIDRFIQCGVKSRDEPPSMGDPVAESSGVGGEELVARVLFPAAKKAINASNLAVRQVGSDSLPCTQ